VTGALAQPPIERTLVRDQAARLIGDETAALARLATLLDEERATLEDDDVEQLEQVSRRRHDCVNRLLAIDDERRNLCRLLSFGDDAAAFPRLIEWSDGDGKLARAWRDCLALAADCRDRNDANGRIVAARLQRVRGLLEVMAGQPSGATVYTTRGLGPTVPSLSQLCVEA